MKIKLAVSEENYKRIADELTALGIEIDDSAELVLTEQGKYVSHLAVRKTDAEGARLHIDAESIIAIEAFGHTIEVRTKDAVYQSTDRLYQLQAILDPKQFIRISNSVIINRSQIKHISPTFSQKFILTMKDGSRADVTRSYYSSFKRAIGI